MNGAALATMRFWPWSWGCRKTDGLLPAAEIEARLEEERLRAERSALPLSVILCDVSKVQGLLGTGRRFDHFIERLSRLLRDRLRRIDIKGWHDGRRLAVVMPATPRRGAQAVLVRLEDWIASYLREAGIDGGADGLLDLATYPDAVRGQAKAEAVGEAQPVSRAVVLFTGGPSAKGMSRYLKRAFDIAGALALLLLTSPVMLVAAVAARLSSPGPAIFKQVRLGEGGRPFVYYKFRSMYVNNDDSMHRDYTRRLIGGEVSGLDNGHGGKLVLKLAADPRVTAVGRVLRRSSLDELPQLFNVLKGDMSLVGPRPPLPYEVHHYRDWHLRRILAAKPGLTGLWQVRSRSASSFDEMVRLDLRYADTWSLWTDLKILGQTLPAVFSARGAY